ncbi:MAG: hypothetical protein WA374_15075, partial [Acidobacteriaceae bacterium]
SQAGAVEAAAAVVSPRRKVRRVGPLVELPIDSIMAQIASRSGAGHERLRIHANWVAGARGLAYSSSKDANVNERRGEWAWRQVKPRR